MRNVVDIYIKKELVSLDFFVDFLTIENVNDLQGLLDDCKDFFLNCEGELGAAEKLLTCLPAQKTLDEKLSFGIFNKENDLIGFFDVILAYPSESSATIGYFLIHPAWRNQGYGQTIFEALARALEKANFKRIQCIVQIQNTQALRFWERVGFSINRKIMQKMDNKINQSFVLDYLADSK